MSQNSSSVIGRGCSSVGRLQVGTTGYTGKALNKIYNLDFSRARETQINLFITRTEQCLYNIR